MAAGADSLRGDLLLAPRLRHAALISFAATPLFLWLDLHFHRADLRSLATFYGAHALLSALAAAATFTEVGQLQAGDVALLLVAGVAVNSNVFLYCCPVYPAVTANILTALMMGSAFFFSWSVLRQVLVCLVVCIGFAIATIATEIQPADPGGAPVAYALATLVLGGGVSVLGASVLGCYRASLARRQAELLELSTRLMSVQEEERRRISRDLHDGVGQSLTAVSAYLHALERQMPPELPELRRRAGDAKRLTARTLAEIRELSQLLRPSVLDDFGLLPSLDTYVKEFQERHGIAVRLTADGLPERLPPPMETALYRVVQEALTNVVRHAQAHRVRVMLCADHDELRLRVDDDGVGIRNGNGHPRHGTGLISMRERVQALGGTMMVASHGGAHLTVRLPLS